jgi:tetratricopeptide (TPR) repeat protein
MIYKNYNIKDARGSNFYIIDNHKIEIPKNLNLLLDDKDQTIGREIELEEISVLLKSGQKTLISTGIGGVGKTKLARYVATQMLKTEQNSNGYYEHIAMIQVDTNLSSKDLASFQSKVVTTFSSVFRKSLAFIPNLPTDEKELYDILVDCTKNLTSPKLLILDDVTKNWLKQNRQQIKTDFSDWDILATSRDGGEYYDVKFKKLILDNLTEENAIILFRNVVAEYQSSLPEEQKIRELVKILGQHALSVTFFASLLSQDLDLTIDEILEKLKQGLNFEHGGVDLEYRNLSQSQVETVMELALDLAKLDQFTETQKTHLRHFSILPSEFIDYKKYKEIFELSLNQENKNKYQSLQTDLDNLTKYGFLEKEGASFKMHKIMQLATQDRLKVGLDNSIYLIKRLVQYFSNYYIEEQKDYKRFFDDLEIGQNVVDFLLKAKQTKFSYNCSILGFLLTNLGDVHSQAGNDKKAEKLYIQSLEICEQQEELLSFNLNSSELQELILNSTYFNILNDLKLKTLNNLAEIYREQGRYLLAEKIFKQLFEIDIKRFGENHPKIATVLNNLGNVYRQQKKYSDAEKVIKKAIKIGKDNIEYSKYLKTLATIYSDQRKYPEAEKLFLEVMEIDKKTIGENNPNYANSLSNLGIMYYNWGKKESDYTKMKLAKKHIEISLKILLSNFDLNHPDTKTVQTCLNAINVELGKELNSN